MKFSKLLAGFGLMFLGSLSINASAQTTVCTWGSVYGYSSGGTSYTTFICRVGGGTVVAASRTDTWTYGPGYTCGTVTVAAGYQNTYTTQGSSYPLNCNTNVIATGTPPASSAAASSAANPCYTGYSQIIQTSPGSYPSFNPANCGPQPQCKHSVVALDQHSYPRLKYTCL